MAPRKLAALLVCFGSLALEGALGQKASFTDETTDVVNAINLLRTGKINNPMEELKRIGNYTNDSKMEYFVNKTTCAIEKQADGKKGFFAPISAAKLDLKDYLTLFDGQLEALDTLIENVNTPPVHPVSDTDEAVDATAEKVKNLKFLVALEAKEAGCGAITCTDTPTSGNKTYYLFCTFDKTEGDEGEAEVTGDPAVEMKGEGKPADAAFVCSKEFLTSLKQRKDAGINLASLSMSDMGKPLPMDPENLPTSGSSAFKVVLSSLVLAVSALSVLFI